MKRLLFLPIFAIILSSCSFIWDPIEDFDYYFQHNEVFENGMVSVLDHTSKIVYEADDVTFRKGYWETPYEIHKYNVGECEEYGIDAGYHAWKDLGYGDDEVYLIFMVSKIVEDGVRMGHVGIKVAGTYYEPQFGGWQVTAPAWDAYAFWEQRFGGFDEFDKIPIKVALYSAVNTHYHASAYNYTYRKLSEPIPGIDF